MRSKGKTPERPSLAEHLKVTTATRLIEIYLKIDDDGARRTNEEVKHCIAEANQPRQSFFLFINYMELHSSYHPQENYALMTPKESDTL